MLIRCASPVMLGMQRTFIMRPVVNMSTNNTQCLQSIDANDGQPFIFIIYSTCYRERGRLYLDDPVQNDY